MKLLVAMIKASAGMCMLGAGATLIVLMADNTSLSTQRWIMGCMAAFIFCLFTAVFYPSEQNRGAEK